MGSDPDYEFTSDWFTDRIPVWEKYVAPLAGRPLEALELGCWEGRASIWLLERVLDHPDSRLTVVDTFEGSTELDPAAFEGLYDRFTRNIRRTGREEKVRVLRSRTTEALVQLLGETGAQPRYDLVYIDASHFAQDVLSDAVLSFPLVKSGGLMIFDDYQWPLMPHELDRPRVAIDSFARVFQRAVGVLHVGYQVLMVKR